MGDRDQALVRSLGVSVAQVAGALDRSRQTVNRGIRSDNEYLKPNDLLKALEAWRRADAGLYAVAKTKICEIYPEIADAILEAAGLGGTIAFSTTVPGEYWLVCGDFVGFRSHLSVCAKQLESLCSLDTAQVKLFVNLRDKVAAQRFVVRFQGEKPQLITCKAGLDLLPTTLLRMDQEGNIDLFGVSDAGFIPLSRHEATRLRVVIQDTLLKRVQTN